MVKNHLQMQEMQKMQVQSLDGEDPWRRAWQPTVLFLPGEAHRWKSLADYSPWDYQESDTTAEI